MSRAKRAHIRRRRHKPSEASAVRLSPERVDPQIIIRIKIPSGGRGTSLDSPFSLLRTKLAAFIAKHDGPKQRMMARMKIRKP